MERHLRATWRTRRSRLRPALLLLLLGCNAAPPGAGPAARLQVRGERVARLQKSYRLGSLATSRDQRRVGWVAQASDASPCRVVVDGVPGPERKACAAPAFAPDGSRSAAWVTTEPAPGAAAVTRLAVDGDLVGPDLVDGGDLRFARVGAAWAASALLAPPPGDAPAAAPRMRVFGPAGDLGTFRDTTAPLLDDRGEHVAWLAALGDERRALFVDGKEVRSFGEPAPSTRAPIRIARPGPNLAPEEVVRWLSDGSLVGIVPSGLGWLVFRANGEAPGEALRDWASHDVLWRGPQPPPGDPLLRTRGSALLSGSLAIAERAAVACWWERPGAAGGRWRVSCNGKPADETTCAFAGTTPISVAPGGGGKAYACLDADGAGAPATFVVANGRRLGPHREVVAVGAADGGPFAYAARDAADAPFFFVVDGRRIPGEWDEVFAPSFSPDGTHVAWGARRAKGSRVDLVLDGRTRARADLVVAPPRVGDDGSASWIVRRGRNVLRVSMNREAAATGEGASTQPDAMPGSGRPRLP